MANNQNTQDKQTKEEKELQKHFAGMTTDDLEAIRRGIDEIRSYANSSMNECIRLVNGHTNYHYLSKSGEVRDNQQDKRVRENALELGMSAIKNLRMYAKKMEDELRGIEKTL